MRNCQASLCLPENLKFDKKFVGHQNLKRRLQARRKGFESLPQVQIL